MNPQLGNLVAYAHKNETDPDGEVDAALLLTSAQATSLAERDTSAVLKQFGLEESPTVVINLVGDVVKTYRADTADAEAQLVSFMHKVTELCANPTNLCTP